MAGVLCFQKPFANDLWKALYSGRYLVQTGHFPHHSTFTFMPVDPYLPRDNWTWLGNLILYGIHSAAGIPGLQLFRAGLLLGSLGLLHSIVGHRRSLLVATLFVLAILGVAQKLMVRNALFLLPGLACLFWIWFRYRCRDSRWIWGLPVLLTVWSNLHGSYLIGLGLAGLLIAGRLVDLLVGSREQLKRECPRLLGVVLLMMGGVVLVHPAGPVEKPIQVLERIVTAAVTGEESSGSPASTASLYERIRDAWQDAVLPKRFYSTEFGFPLEHPRKRYVITSLLVLGLGLLCLVREGTGPGFALGLALLGALFVGGAYLRAVAVIPMTVLGVVFIHGHDRENLLRTGGLWTWSLCVFFLMFFLIQVFYGHPFASPDPFSFKRYHPLGLEAHPRFSHSVPEFAARHVEPGSFYNGYNLGSWLIWSRWPRLQVFIDSKNSAYRPEVRRMIFTQSPVEIIRDRGLKYALFSLDRDLLYYYFIPSPKWAVRAYDQATMLVEKRSGSPEEPGHTRELIPGPVEARLGERHRSFLNQVRDFLEDHADRTDAVGRYRHPADT